MARNKINICKEYHIQPSEIDRLQYWEYEEYLEEINNIQEEQKKQQEEEQKQQSSSSNYPSLSSIQNIASGFKMPSFTMPKL